ncbi:glycosyltransferase [Cronbergia sp. UHCC 0137]|uniref:glycosyltransferase n=1 Tax=Cronbergia sp. UHCC 0137 TaxID=3110239 RepID=UPI002B1F7241|nr:glycosyltransferase [Cronbergia sp. UHCC 0137]MEA5620789.1 glycosyltransferase [Cronbergia sp. UHCC 0137]
MNYIQPKIIVISSVQPKPTSAGQALLYRHLNQLDGWDIEVIEAPKPTLMETLLHRMQNTRFHYWANDLEVLMAGSRWKKPVRLNKFSNSETIILTVAHEDGCWEALRFSKINRIPLVTFFNDWYPDFPSAHNKCKQLLNKRFKNLYIKSDLAFCASEGMKQSLGNHPNSYVLYGIPAILENKAIVDKYPSQLNEQNREFNVLYFGNLYDYGSIIATFLQEIKNNPRIRGQVRGAKPNWTQDFHSEMRDRNLWLDFAPREELDQWLASADAFLVVMSFDPALRRRMETSFPTKIAEYAQFGKPLVIWGPDYCSAILWGRGGDRALCVTDQNPAVLVSALENLKQSPEKQEYYAQQAKIAAQAEFNPVLIQNQFLEHISNLIIKT